jgi:ABC-type nitrate/sulfonate/bicarbonate transport system ATPase subunit
MISIKNVSVTYSGLKRKKTHVLHDVNLEVSPGEFLVILGPSGCGKSTLLRTIAGFEHHYHGEIVFDKALSPHDISFVFQDFGILPWLTVAENVELSLIGRHVSLIERKHKVTDILKRFGLLEFAEHKPRDLSGGMKQRVGLARAFVTDPKLILLDEPFSELDFFTASKLRAELLLLWQEKKTTIVMVSHYMDEAVELADHIAVFSDRPGTVKKIIRNIISRPRNARSPEFFALEDELLTHLNTTKK